LTADPADCVLPQVALGITATGAAVCSQPSNVTGSAATVTAAAQPAITSVGTLTGLTINGPLTISGGNSITMTGSLAATGARVLKGWFTDLQVTNTIVANVNTATSLLNDPADCAGVNFALGVTANGTAVCAQPSNITGNAHTVDGYHAGNAAGQVAVSNGTLNSTLNADMVDGLHVATAFPNSAANQIIRTDGSGQTWLGWINTVSGDNGTTAISRIYASNDQYIRYYTPANFATVMAQWLVRTDGTNASYVNTPASYAGSLQGIVNAGVYFTEATAASTLGPVAGGSGAFLQLGDAGGSDVRLQFYVDSAGNNMWFQQQWGASAWKGWRKVWSDSNDGSGSGLDADLLDGMQPNTGAAVSTIVQRDGSGDTTVRYLFSEYLNMSHGVGSRSGDSVFYSSYDTYLRKNDAPGFRASLNVPTRTGGDASGTWNINVTGNSGTSDKVNGIASNPNNAHPGTGLRPFYSWNTGCANNGAGACYSNGIAVGSHPGDQSYGFQIVQNMWDDRLYFRRYQGNYTGQSWFTVIDSGIIGSQTVSNVTALSGLWTGISYFQTNAGSASGASGLSSNLQVYSTGGNAAFMSFHRSGSYAVNMGLDSDNVFRIGGWSAAANRLQLDMSGNLTLAGSVSGAAVYDNSKRVLTCAFTYTQCKGGVGNCAPPDCPAGSVDAGYVCTGAFDCNRACRWGAP